VTHGASLAGDKFGAGRVIGTIVVRRAGALVKTPEATVPYAVTDADGAEVDAFAGYLRHVTAADFSGLSIRSYGLALLRWLRFLDAVDVAWDQAEQAEVRDFVLWMRQAAPGRRHRPGAPVPGSVNPRTGKRYLGEGFAPATINHNLTVIKSFYDFCIGQGGGPLRNPVPARPGGPRGRANAHHNPLEPFHPGRRGAYRQRVPETAPRAIPDALFDELFAALGCDRDRAILALYVSTGARPSELLPAAMGTHPSGDQPATGQDPAQPGT
jgi:integrase